MFTVSIQKCSYFSCMTHIPHHSELTYYFQEFCCRFLVIFYMDYMSSAVRVSFISSFLICMPSISFSCLPTLARTSSNMLKSSGKGRHPSPVSDFKRKTYSLKPLSTMLVGGFLQMFFIKLKKFPSIPSFQRVFKKYLFIYLFGCAGSQLQHVGSSLWYAGSLVEIRDLLVMACELLVAACGIQFPDQGLNPGPLHWEHGALATGPPGKFPESFFFNHEQLSNFVKCFSASTEMIILFFFFSLFVWWITLIVQVLNQPCNRGINPTWPWCIIHFIYC